MMHCLKIAETRQPGKKWPKPNSYHVPETSSFRQHKSFLLVLWFLPCMRVNSITPKVHKHFLPDHEQEQKLSERILKQVEYEGAQRVKICFG